MIETLRTTVEGLDWRWSYGLKEMANLEESASADDTKPFFHLDPVIRKPIYSKNGFKTDWQIVSGGFLILVKNESSIAETYDTQSGQDKEDGKWKKRIRPMVESVGGNTSLIDQLMSELNCIDDLSLQVKSQSITEVINFFDDNLDGVNVRFEWKVKA